MEIVLDVFLDALKDSAIILPFIFLIYVVMELIESANNKEKIERALSGKFAPCIASATGIVPECGFSVMCAKLFDNGLIAIGTVVAAFISASDEGLIVMISNIKTGIDVRNIVILVSTKIVFATVIGLAVNVLFKKFNTAHVCPKEDDCVECGEHSETKLHKFFLHPLYHALKTFAVIFAFNLLFGAIIELVGKEQIESFVATSGPVQPLFSAIVGLIPSCASSTIIAQSYCNHVLTFSGLIAGLSVNSGVGLLVLFKKKDNFKRNVIILSVLFVSAIAIGYFSMLFGI